MTIQFVEEARDEFLDAISHYEEVRADLGRRFKEEVDRSDTQSIRDRGLLN